MLREVLDDLEQHLRNAGVRSVEYLRPGLSKHEVAVRLETRLGTAPDELVEWFSWHDGFQAPHGPNTRGEASPPFIAWLPLPLEAATDRTARWLDQGDKDFQPGWLPLAQRSDPHDLIAQTTPDLPTVSIVTRYSYELGLTEIASSLEELVTTWITLISRTDIHYDQDRWVIDDLPSFPRDLLRRAALIQAG